MMKKNSKILIRTLLFALLLLFGKFYSQTNNGSVGINTVTPNANSVLDVVSGENNKGILVPRLTEAQRNAITINPATDNGLTIYNVTESCYNYWSLADNEWKSVCGQMGKSAFTIDCTTTKVMGTYIQNKELTASNYLTVKVNVTKIGSYTIAGTTSNGYNFYGTGVFLSTGMQTVSIPGQGVPGLVQADSVQLFANETNVTCNPAIIINVLNSSGTYSVSCGSATVNGVYTKGVALTGSNTITLPVVVSAVGSYSVTTNTVDGISFAGSGTFTSTGNQSIILYGTGSPTSTDNKIMTITANSADGASTCNVTVEITIPIKKVLHIGAESMYGYSAFTGPSRSLMDSSTNFGAIATSVVKSGGFIHTSLGASPSSSELLTALSSKPDIVIMGYPYFPDTTAAGYIADYLNKKGVVIAFQDDLSSLNIMRAIFSDPSISTSSGGGAGSVYALPNIDDPILNGPFGDIRGKNWGESASTTVTILGLTSGFIPYSYAQPINNTITRTGISGLRHSSLYFIWFGDGGFLSNENADGSEYVHILREPFVAPSSGGYFPVEKSSYGYAGNGYTTGGMQVQNSILFANMLAWAIKQAESNGINTQ
ncbi:hypothetical protein LXM63_09215 [Chryseobacterium gleum]|uniref:hypothetical protein n=1 Tax=Chryseobacterium gleum TaxID=250 RepID=UPI001E56AC3E|nr:hypothetical protein [Chryseobacterium gleum]MCE4065277.1 hypothetical protein [Chryseobacterium gleum]